ncbi:MAG: transposase [Ignavibacteriae bacterium]|nr:transposase [Ignavibacteriota bacterium]
MSAIQEELFPPFQKSLDEPLSDKQKKLISILEVIEIEKYVQSSSYQWMGRKIKDRCAIARAFVAKAVYDMPTTRSLIEGLHDRANLRRICGFGKQAYKTVYDVVEKDGQLERVAMKKSTLPSESTFSRAFSEFSESELGDKVHEALVGEYLSEELVGHISRDATAIEGNEKAVVKGKEKSIPKKQKRGRPKNGEHREPKEERRLSIQVEQRPAEALKKLPIVCDVGCKTNAKGYKETWKGYKLHIDTADCGLPVTSVLTSASLHDSQVAIPMIKLTSAKIIYLYDLMDAAYDSKEINDVSRLFNHVPIIDSNRRRGDAIPMAPAEAVRYNERSAAERTNGRLKEEFGGRTVMVKGYKKVKMHLMFGVIALFGDQLLKLVL